MHPNRILLRTAALALLASPAFAQTTATFELFGEGCNGATLSNCLTLNDQNPTLQVSSLPNEYAYPVVNTTGGDIQIVGFEIFTVTNTGNVETVNTGLLWDASGPAATVHTQPDPTNAANGKITVTGTQGWYSTSIYPPIVVPAGVAFWFHVDAYALVAPPQHTTTGGVGGPVANWYRRPSNGMVWTRSVSVARQIFRIHCLPASPQVPTIDADQPPRLGQNINFAIGSGQSVFPGLFIVGLDGTQWAGFPTPVDLGLLGAPGCRFYSSSDVISQVTFNASGVATVGLSVPNLPTLSGVELFVQGGALSPGANALSVIFSGAGKGVIGT